MYILTDGSNRIFTVGEIWPPGTMPLTHLMALHEGRVRNVTNTSQESI